MGKTAPGPPTFSSGVDALRVAQVGRLWHSRLLETASNLAALAIVALWAASTGLEMALILRACRAERAA